MATVGALHVDESKMGSKATPPLATHRTGEAGAKRRRLMGSDGEMLDVPDDGRSCHGRSGRSWHIEHSAEEAATFELEAAADEEEEAASADADEPAAPKTETELRYEAEAAYEARVWPDALPGAVVQCTPASGSSMGEERDQPKTARVARGAKRQPTQSWRAASASRRARCGWAVWSCVLGSSMP